MFWLPLWPPPDLTSKLKITNFCSQWACEKVEKVSLFHTFLAPGKAYPWLYKFTLVFIWVWTQWDWWYKTWLYRLDLDLDFITLTLTCITPKQTYFRQNVSYKKFIFKVDEVETFFKSGNICYLITINKVCVVGMVNKHSVRYSAQNFNFLFATAGFMVLSLCKNSISQLLASAILTISKDCNHSLFFWVFN